MNTSQIKKELHQYIDKGDHRLINIMYALAKEYTKEPDDIVGYNVDGSPIKKVDLKKRVKSASERVKSGDYIPQEEIEKEVKN